MSSDLEVLWTIMFQRRPGSGQVQSPRNIGTRFAASSTQISYAITKVGEQSSDLPAAILSLQPPPHVSTAVMARHNDGDNDGKHQDGEHHDVEHGGGCERPSQGMTSAAEGRQMPASIFI
jgi:hypothetical protein